MELTRVVQIGGRLALLAGLVVSSLASGTTISYFYGYSSPGLTTSGAVDPFASQNVAFVPQVPMVSSGLASYSAWGYSYGSNLAVPSTPNTVNYNTTTTYGSLTYDTSSIDYAPAAVSYGSVYGNSSPTYSGGYGGYSSFGSTGGQGYGSSFFTPSSSYVNVNGFSSFNAWQSPVSTGLGGVNPEPPQIVAWQPIRDSMLPAVSGNFGSPSVLPQILPPTNPNHIQDIGAFSTPEPASFVLLAAGLGGLVLLRRRRRSC